MSPHQRPDDFIDTTTLRRIASGLTFAEGPVWVPEREELLFSDLRASKRYGWSPSDGRLRTASAATAKGNGMTLSRDGRLLVCEHATSTVVAMDSSGDGGGRTVLASHFEGLELNSPNDVVERSDGSIWFTDPPAGRRNDVSGVKRDVELDFQAVFRLDVDGTLTPVASGFELCNGLAFSPDESKLYVTDTYAGCVFVLDVDRRGDVTARDTLIDEAGAFSESEGWHDGLRCDESGNIWTTAPGGLWVLSPGGERLATIELPEPATNLAWGGDGHTLFITASTRVFEVRTLVAGATRETRDE